MITCYNWTTYRRQRAKKIHYHSVFKSWECSVESKAFQIITSSNMRIVVPPKEPWKRREIYSISHIQEHAFIANAVLQHLAPGTLFAEHQWPNVPWASSARVGFRGRQRSALLREGNPNVDLRTFKGGLVLTAPFVAFIDSFIDYAFVEKRQSLNLFGKVQNQAIITRLSNHLTVDFISDSEAILNQVAELLKTHGLIQREDVPSVYCRPDQREWG